MPKRQRKPCCNEKSYYRKKRRHNNVSPSRGDIIEMDNATKLTMLQLEVDILRAQISLLQKQLRELCPPPSTGKKQEIRGCWIM